MKTSVKHSQGESRIARLSAPLNKLPVPLFVVDANQELIFINSHLNDLLQLSAEEKVSSLSDLEQILDVNLQSRFSRVLSGLSDDHDDPFLCVTPSGRTLLLRLKLMSLGDDDVTPSVLGMVTDLTTALQSAFSPRDADGGAMQDERKFAAIERSTLLAEVTHQVAHALRNPLTIIGGFASLLKRNLDPADKLSEYAGIIVAEAAKVEKSLADTLDFSKSLADKKSTVDLNELIGAAVQMVRQRGDRTGRLLHLKRADTSLPVQVNPDQTVQCLYDVLELLLTELPEGTTLDIEVASSSDRRQVKIGFVSETEIEKHLTKVFRHQSAERSPRLTLTLETIRHNGGDLGLEASAAGNVCVYVEYPAV
ncbi:MAG: hypothetical protein KAT58_03335 [candidate division Zixibacteria bacterium]|nr:hypothetical protein [candidate division Zixibacteria bacterium]